MRTPSTVRDRVLQVVRDEPGSTSTDIANDLQLPVVTVAGALSKLLVRGLVVRQQMRAPGGLSRWSYRAACTP